MGATDPRPNQSFDTDHHLKRNFSAWKIEDPLDNRVKPVPISIICCITYIAERLPSTAHLLRDIAAMIRIHLFFLLCPGKYTNGKSDTNTFTVGNVQIFIGNRRLDLVNISDAEINKAWSAFLTFTT